MHGINGKLERVSLASSKIRAHGEKYSVRGVEMMWCEWCKGGVRATHWYEHFDSYHKFI